VIRACSMVLALIYGSVFASTAASAFESSLQNKASGLFVDVPENNTGLILFHGTGLANQKFEFQGTGRGPLKIIAKHSGKCLDVKDFSLADGAVVQQFDCIVGNHNQEWMIEVIFHAPPCGTIGCAAVSQRFRAVHSGKCLDAGNTDFEHRPPAEHAPLQQFTCAKDTGDKFWVDQGFEFFPPFSLP
jgi:hypothetical protein